MSSHNLFLALIAITVIYQQPLAKDAGGNAHNITLRRRNKEQSSVRHTTYRGPVTNPEKYNRSYHQPNYEHPSESIIIPKRTTDDTPITDNIFRNEKKLQDSLPLPHQKYDENETPVLSFGSDGLNPEIGGDRAASKWEFPYHIQVRWDDIGFVCGATLVRLPALNRQIVVTAAHCLFRNGTDEERVPRKMISLHAGILGKEEFPVQSRRLLKAIPHPEYKCILRLPYFNDIAILIPESEFEESETVKGIELSVPYEPPTLDCVTVAGWGIKREAGNIGPSSLLRTVQIPVWDNDECDKNYFKEFGFHVVTENHFCAGNKNGGLDTCQGDSGGGAVRQYLGRTYFLGIVSWGKGCGEKGLPGIYTRVSRQMKWIIDTMIDLG